MTVKCCLDASPKGSSHLRPGGRLLSIIYDEKGTVTVRDTMQQERIPKENVTAYVLYRIQRWTRQG